jgi:hypothetical protein
MRFLSRKNLAKLLEGPEGGRMSGDIEVSDPARSYFHNHKDAEDSKGGRHSEEEIAGEDSLGMISYECHPTLRRKAFTRSPVIL